MQALPGGLVFKHLSVLSKKRDCRASLAMTKLGNDAPMGSLRGAYATKHPLKGVRQEKKSLLCEPQGFCTNLADGLPGCFYNLGASSPILHPYFLGKRCQTLLHQAPIGIKAGVLNSPFRHAADQKIFGTMPCPEEMYNLVVINQLRNGSRHGQ